jgi:tetrahydromethanopterin S-methyltransferase subunit E
MRDPAEFIDIGIGIVGFFSFAFLVVTAATELTGGDALGWALTLLGLLILLGCLLLWRRGVGVRARIRSGSTTR